MNSDNRYITDFLFTTPTFLTGVGTIMNLAGNFYKYNTSSSEYEADCIALRNDFNMVGQDLHEALNHVKENDYSLIK